MTIDEAVKTLSLAVNNEPVIPHSKLHVAQRLGIEALKSVRAQYDPDHQMMRRLLPGETLDGI